MKMELSIPDLIFLARRLVHDDRHDSRYAELTERLERIERLLRTIYRMEVMQMATVDDILAGLAELPTIDQSLDAVFVALQQLIEQGKQDPAKLDQALSLLTEHKDRVKADIVANTPAA